MAAKVDFKMDDVEDVPVAKRKIIQPSKTPKSNIGSTYLKSPVKKIGINIRDSDSNTSRSSSIRS